MRKALLAYLVVIPSAAFVNPAFAGAELLRHQGQHFVSSPLTSAQLPRGLSPHAHLLRTLPHARTFELTEGTRENFNDGSVTHFTVRHRGLEVVGADAVVRLDKDGLPIVVVDALPSAESMPNVTPTLQSLEAETIARRALTLPMPNAKGTLLIQMHNGEARLAWRFEPPYPLAFAYQPRILVDAHTGDVLQVHNRVRFIDQVRAFKSNPIASPNTELFTMASPPEGATLETPFLKSGNCIDNKKVSVVDVGFGSPVPLHLCDIEQTALRNAEGDFDYLPQDGTPDASEDPFSEAAMFYHAGRAQEFFRTLQGDPAAQVVNGKPLRTVANLRTPAGLFSGDLNRAKDPNLPLEAFTNAFFSPGGGIESLLGISGAAIVFGQGDRRDFAYDGDVVYHEFTHAVVDKTLNLGGYNVDTYGASAAPGGMNEGLADYFSSAITGDPDVGEYAAQEISQNAGVIRSLANKDSCPASLVGEVHADSTFFSAALWDARQSLPETDRQSFDAALYKAMRTSPALPQASYEEIASLFAGVMQTDLPAGAAALRKSFAERNILPACRRIMSAADGVFTAPKYGAGLNAWTVFSTQDLGTGIAPGLLQFSRTIPAGTKRLVVNTNIRGARGGGFGGGGKLDPVILVRFNKPIEWSGVGSRLKHNADLERKAEGDIGETFEIPEGVTELYVQIANNGSAGGSYRDIELSIAEKPVKPGRPDAGATPSAAPPAAVTASGGCGCNQASTGYSAGWATIAFGAFAFLRSRRKSRA